MIRAEGSRGGASVFPPRSTDAPPAAGSFYDIADECNRLLDSIHATIDSIRDDLRAHKTELAVDRDLRMIEDEHEERH